MPGAYTSAGPPTKRHKGNPIITKYPMPPGYGPSPLSAPPATGQPPYNAMQQQPQQRHSFAQPSPSPLSGWNAQPTTNFSQPRPVTQPQPVHSFHNPWQQPTKPAVQHLPQPIGPPRPASSAGPSPATTPTVSVTAPGPPKQTPSTLLHKPSFKQIHHDPNDAYDIEFGDDDASQPRSASIVDTDIDPNLSLGIITWHPPRPTTTALAPTFDLAQQDLVTPPPPRKPEDSTSRLHAPDQRYHVNNSVRSSPDWTAVKDDIIFRMFQPGAVFVRLQTDFTERGRPLPDPDQSHHEGEASAPTRLCTSDGGMTNGEAKTSGSLSAKPETRRDDDDDDQAMDMASDGEEDSNPEPVKVDSAKSDQTPPTSSKPSVLDGLEEMLTKARRGPKPQQLERQSPRLQSRQSSHASDQIFEQARSRQGSQGLASATDTPPKPRQTAEDAQTASEKQSPNGHRSGPAHTTDWTQTSYGLHNIPPPPPPLAATSASSRAHLAAPADDMPDVDMEDDSMADDTPPKVHGHPVLGRTASTRKRTFEETQGPQQEERRRQEDDLTPRLRRQRQKMEPAYR